MSRRTSTASSPSRVRKYRRVSSNSCLPGTLRATFSCPPISLAASNSVTSWPRSAALTAQASPAGPAPTTATRLRRRVGESTSSVSWQARGFTRQEVIWPLKVWSRQAWLQPMQVLIASGRPSAALATKSGSASIGRAMDTMSAVPSASSRSASSGGVDAVGGDQGDGHLAHEALGDPGVGAARDGGGDGGDAGLVPADAGVDDRGAGGLDCLGEGDHLVEGGAAGHQVEHGEPVDQDEVLADRLAHPADDLDGEAHPVLVGAAPAVGAPVGLPGDELVDQVPLGAHDLDAVVAGLPGEAGGAHVVVDRPLDVGVGELAGREGADGRLEGAGRDQVPVVGVAAEVQDLEGDAAALAVDGRGDDPVLLGLLVGGEPGAALVGASLVVGGDAAGDDEAHAAAGAGGVELGHAGEAALGLLETDVHGTHEDPVGQRGEAQVQGGQQVGVTAHLALRARCDACSCRARAPAYATSCIREVTEGTASGHSLQFGHRPHLLSRRTCSSRSWSPETLLSSLTRNRSSRVVRNRSIAQ